MNDLESLEKQAESLMSSINENSTLEQIQEAEAKVEKIMEEMTKIVSEIK
jgi:GTP cyclohydrolase I